MNFKISDPRGSSIVRSGENEVVTPDVVPVSGPQSDTGPVVEPQSFASWLFHRHFESLLSPESFDALVIHAPTRRNTALFLAHLYDLRRRLRTYCKIHVICDNAAFHKSRAVQKYLQQWGHRIELHFLPTYAPETNLIERVWWHLHETITRNHQCTTIEDLLREVYDWFAAEQFFPIETSLYRLAA